MKRALLFMAYVLLLAISTYAMAHFLGQNTSPVQLQFWLWRTTEIQMGALISIVFLVGVVISSAILMGSVLSQSIDAKRLRRENAALQRMIERQESSSPLLPKAPPPEEDEVTKASKPEIEVEGENAEPSQEAVSPPEDVEEPKAHSSSSKKT